MTKLTALIITYNEIDRIRDCIQSISFADEIIVIDSYSKDGTYEYLKNLSNVKVLQNPFENFTKQKTYALEQAHNDWILFIDADERIPPRLQDEIVSILKSEKTNDAYWCYRIFMFKNKQLRFSGFQTDKAVRLFKKSKCHFRPNRIVHERLEVNGTTGTLKNKLIHFSYRNFKVHKEKIIKYARLRAREEFKKAIRPNWFHFYVKPTYRFLYNYLIRLGFLDGRKGIIMCYMGWLGVYVRYKELKKMYNSTDN
ncbi:glycosyltransferase family 2 protein [Leptobacterium sp. I13]|uniref:glycosyltransferase family 2 protein n=1 Tax=Leptobacterium meishanense TaxID=3128904 RepID=UPI0030ED5C3E